MTEYLLYLDFFNGLNFGIMDKEQIIDILKTHGQEDILKHLYSLSSDKIVFVTRDEAIKSG